MSARPDELVTLVTCRAHPRLPEDEALLLRALERRAIGYRIAVWNDPEVDWSRTPLTVLRSAWESHLDPSGFDSWLLRLQACSQLLNGLALIRWNFDKQYLLELHQRGFEVVPTVIVTEPSGAIIRRALSDLAAAELVVKPRFGADTFGVARVAATVEAVSAHYERFGHRHGGLLVQPYLPAIEQERERSLIFIAHRFSHALYRNAFGRGATRQTVDNLHWPTSAELDYCERLLGSLPQCPSYARVDLVPIAGHPTLMELELIDPSLFLAAQPSAAESLAEEIEWTLQACR